MIYLDNAATTFPKPEIVYEEMDRVNRTLAVNAGRGSYKSAQQVSRILDETRHELLNLFHAEGIADICFGPSITYAMNQVLGGVVLDESSVIYMTPYEHNAVARTIHLLQKKKGFSVEMLPLTADLRIDLEKIAYQFTQKHPDLIIVNKISNVTGYVLPAEQIFQLGKKYDAITVMDAAQAAGLWDIDMGASDVDIICFAGHKTLYGPFGIGGFAIKHGIMLNLVYAGGTGSNSLELDMPISTPERFEASSPNIIAIAGLHASMMTLNQKAHLNHAKEMTEYLLSKLKGVEKVQVMGAYDSRNTVGIVSFVVDGYLSSDVGSILDDEYDISVRTGYHCAPYIHEYLDDKVYGGTVRVGIGLFTTKSDIDSLIEALETL